MKPKDVKVKWLRTRVFDLLDFNYLWVFDLMGEKWVCMDVCVLVVGLKLLPCGWAINLALTVLPDSAADMVAQQTVAFDSVLIKF